MIPQITLNNGICVPQLSIGTYKVDDLQSVTVLVFKLGWTLWMLRSTI